MLGAAEELDPKIMLEFRVVEGNGDDSQNDYNLEINATINPEDII